MDIVSETASFGGTQGVYRHQSAATGTAMTFSAYLPPQVADRRCPVLFRDACAAAGVDLTLRLHPRYDHSYYFVASFMDEWLRAPLRPD